MNYKKLLLFFAIMIGYLHHVHASEIFKKPHAIAMETGRLALRLIDAGDVDDIFEFTSDPAVAELTAMFTLHTTHDETEKFIKRHLESYKKQSSIPWVIVYKPHNKVVGFINLFSYIPTHCRAEIGCVISREYWGRGIAMEAGIAVLDFGFTSFGLHKIHATADPRNIQIRRTLEKCGFRYEGCLREHYYYLLEGIFCDRLVYSMLRSEFIQLYS